MNYVLAKLQGYLPDLETLSELDLDAQTIQAIEIQDTRKTAAKPKVDVDSLIRSTIQPERLETLEEQRKVGYTRMDLTQIGEVNPKDADGYSFAAFQLAFKPPKCVFRMPDTRSTTPMAKAIQVTSYDTIMDEILAKRLNFKNPGYLDSQSIPDGPLRDILTSRLDPSLKKE
ncbi:MAG: hypothetical protein MMC33_002452 [Icmadophila ericetorum]|nr:hypothetical protein [Icmadophila ericetorum]